jgi:hypothetical protein
MSMRFRRRISALSVIPRGCRSPRREMEMATDILPSRAIQMGMRCRMLMVIRKAIRCGVLGRRCSSVRWRDNLFLEQGTLCGAMFGSRRAFSLGHGVLGVVAGRLSLGFSGTAVLCPYGVRRRIGLSCGLRLLLRRGLPDASGGGWRRGIGALRDRRWPRASRRTTCYRRLGDLSIQP